MWIFSTPLEEAGRWTQRLEVEESQPQAVQLQTENNASCSFKLVVKQTAGEKNQNKPPGGWKQFPLWALVHKLSDESRSMREE